MVGLRAGLLTIAATASALAAQQGATRPVSPIHAGQEWHYRTRPGEEASTLIVLRVESDAKAGTVVHIALRNVRIRNPRVPGGYSTSLPHAPISEAALRASITELVADSVALPDFQAGYDEWQRAHGGVWSISVAEIVATVERTLGGS